MTTTAFPHPAFRMTPGSEMTTFTKQAFDKKVRHILVDNFKPCYLRDNDREQPRVVFVTPGGKQEDMLAIPVVYRGVRGQPLPSARHSGLNVRNRSNFIVAFQILPEPVGGVNKQVLAVHEFPKKPYLPQVITRDGQDIYNISASIEAETGEVFISHLPKHLTEQDILTFVTALSALEELKAGQVIVQEPMITVLSNMGNVFEFSVAAPSQARETTFGAMGIDAL